MISIVADSLVFANTGKHLYDLQQIILKGTFQEEKYSTIAEVAASSEGHIKNIASELWYLLSKAFG
ncbi:MAG: hypothetical protein ACKPH7_35320 [Planktothrix sp.]|uniref:hypothetical protein n=1 Tax=Planktothrix sp. TaxID=3088171 RepID=UPI0038D50664